MVWGVCGSTDATLLGTWMNLRRKVLEGQVEERRGTLRRGHAEH